MLARTVLLLASMPAPKPDVVGQARSASRWMYVLGLYDVFAMTAVALTAALFLASGPAGLIALPFAGLGLAFLGYRAHHQLRAAAKIRAGVEKKDGATFAAGFSHLRKLLIVSFVLNLGAILYGGGL